MRRVTVTQSGAGAGGVGGNGALDGVFGGGFGCGDTRGGKGSGGSGDGGNTLVGAGAVGLIATSSE